MEVYDPYKYYLPGQKKIFRWKLFRFLLTFLAIGWMVGIVCGYAWRYVQVEPTRDKEITSLKEQVDHYKNHWSPNRELEVKASGRKK